MTTHKEVKPVIKAKPIVWQDETDGAYDPNFGFHIYFDTDEPLGKQYVASCGESDSENFNTLDEAKKYCQDSADAIVSTFGIIEPNTTTIPTAEYEQMLADAESLKEIRRLHDDIDRAKGR